LLVGPLQTRLLLAFVGASLLFAIRDRLPLDWRVAIAAALAAWFTARASTAVHAIAWTVAVPYLMVFLAYRTPSALRRLVRPGDLSYGIYLWAFPVQQAVISILGAGVAPGWVLLVAGTITYVAAFISWRLIEAPALRLKQRLRVKGAARPTPALA
jgi:peptidoglycan/LPS O-acetylase OafA/YrhL